MGLIDGWKRYKLYRLYDKAVDHPELMKTQEFWIQVYKTAWEVKEIREMLSGIKTYLVAGLAAAVTVAHMLGYIDEAMFQNLMALLGAGAVTTVAAKLNRNFNEIKK